MKHIQSQYLGLYDVFIKLKDGTKKCWHACRLDGNEIPSSTFKIYDNDMKLLMEYEKGKHQYQIAIVPNGNCAHKFERR